MSSLSLSGKLPPSLLIPLAAIGAGTVTYGLIKTLLTIWTYVRPSSLPRYHHCKQGSWALVTGASDGIGRAFVDQLLAQGFNVVLHGRNEDKLKRIIRELEVAHGSNRCSIIVADATDTKLDFAAIRRKIESLPGKLTVLVNNVGGISASRLYQRLEGNSTSDLVNCINANATFTTCITSALLPVLEANGPSLILNCGSIGAIATPPYLSTYLGTKGYIHAWSASLAAEVKAEGAPIEVLTLVIGNTSSNSNTYDEPGITLTSAACAKACLQMVGCGMDLVIPHPTYLASVLPLYFLPQSFFRSQMLPLIKKRYDAEEDEARKAKMA